MYTVEDVYKRAEMLGGEGNLHLCVNKHFLIEGGRTILYDTTNGIERTTLNTEFLSWLYHAKFNHLSENALLDSTVIHEIDGTTIYFSSRVMGVTYVYDWLTHEFGVVDYFDRKGEACLSWGKAVKLIGLEINEAGIWDYKQTGVLFGNNTHSIVRIMEYKSIENEAAIKALLLKGSVLRTGQNAKRAIACFRNNEYGIVIRALTNGVSESHKMHSTTFFSLQGHEVLPLSIAYDRMYVFPNDIYCAFTGFLDDGYRTEYIIRLNKDGARAYFNPEYTGSAYVTSWTDNCSWTFFQKRGHLWEDKTENSWNFHAAEGFGAVFDDAGDALHLPIERYDAFGKDYPIKALGLGESYLGILERLDERSDLLLCCHNTKGKYSLQSCIFQNKPLPIDPAFLITTG